MSSIVLTEGELVQLCGGLTQPRRQLTELHRRGFTRARLGVNGRVVLERVHFEAVSAGALPAANDRRDTPAPQVQPIRPRKAA